MEGILLKDGRHGLLTECNIVHVIYKKIKCIHLSVLSDHRTMLAEQELLNETQKTDLMIEIPLLTLANLDTSDRITVQPSLKCGKEKVQCPFLLPTCWPPIGLRVREETLLQK